MKVERSADLQRAPREERCPPVSSSATAPAVNGRKSRSACEQVDEVPGNSRPLKRKFTHSKDKPRKSPPPPRRADGSDGAPSTTTDAGRGQGSPLRHRAVTDPPHPPPPRRHPGPGAARYGAAYAGWSEGHGGGAAARRRPVCAPWPATRTAPTAAAGPQAAATARAATAAARGGTRAATAAWATGTAAGARRHPTARGERRL